MKKIAILVRLALDLDRHMLKAEEFFEHRRNGNANDLGHGVRAQFDMSRASRQVCRRDPHEQIVKTGDALDGVANIRIEPRKYRRPNVSRDIGGEAQRAWQ